MKSMTKSQLARKAGVSRWTLRRWLRDPYIQQQLARYQLTEKQQLLPPGAVQILEEIEKLKDLYEDPEYDE